MDISIFKDYQEKSNKRFMCINKDHAAPLVPFRNLDLEIELKCFAGHCDYKVKPGLDTYNRIIKELNHD